MTFPEVILRVATRDNKLFGKSLNFTLKESSLPEKLWLLALCLHDMLPCGFGISSYGKRIEFIEVAY